MTKLRLALILLLTCSSSLQATDLFWRFNTGGNWDAATANWTNSAGTVTTFNDSGVDSVEFKNSGGGTITITANMTPTTSTVSAVSGTYNFTGGPIDGGILVKTGGGLLQLQSMNTFAGGTIFNGGTIEVNDGGAFGSGTIAASGNIVMRGVAGAGAIAIANPITLNGTIGVAGGGFKSLTFSGPWTLLGDSVIDPQGGGGSAIIRGNIGESGGSRNLTILGANPASTSNIWITGLNTYSGSTVLTAAVNQSIITITGTNLNTSGTAIYGTETRVGSALAFGTSTVTIGNKPGFTPLIAGLVGAAGTITLSNSFLINAPAVAIEGGGYGALTYAGPIVLGTNVSLLHGTAPAIISGNISGNFGINIGSHPTVSPTTFLTLSGSNTYTGATILGAGAPAFGTFYDAGRLQVSGGNAIPDSSPVILTNISNTTLDLANSTERIGSLAGGGSSGGNVTLGSGTLITGGNGSNTTFSGVISGSSGKLTKEGSSAFTLAGANTYTGATTVNGGKLLVNGSLSSSSAVAVNSGGTLGGTGTVGAVTVASGGTLAPGNSPGILHLSNMSMAASSTFSIEINGPTVGTDYDQSDVTGTVGLTNSILQIAMGYSPTNGTQFIIINNDLSDAVGGTFAGLPQGSFIDASSGGNNGFFNISYTGGTGNDVVLTATIPEPATLCLLALGGLLLFRRRQC